MNFTKFIGLAACAITLLMSASAFAHHGRGLLYDSGKEMSVKGTVTEFVWSNPHVQIGLDGMDAKGTRRQWLLEASSTGILAERGWTRRSLKVGDTITVMFHPGMRGALTGDVVKIVLPDGKELPNGAAR